MKDLVLLVADNNMRAILQGALSRPKAMGIKPISFDFRVHFGRDGGVRTTGPDVLAPEHRRFNHALLVLDHEGSGTTYDALSLEQILNAKLDTQWDDRAKSVVIAPELEVWMWGADGALREVFGWPGEGPIRDWLIVEGFEIDGEGKPRRPKEALEAIIRVHRKPRSSALYEQVARKISLKRCRDAAFVRLRGHLQSWFGV